MLTSSRQMVVEERHAAGMEHAAVWSATSSWSMRRFQPVRCSNAVRKAMQRGRARQVRERRSLETVTQSRSLVYPERAAREQERHGRVRLHGGESGEEPLDRVGRDEPSGEDHERDRDRLSG